ncbi:hypothetical protein QM797_07190 [Rhodococcus sp. IEGM 1381]|uniref:linalool dehydratase/isomerase domain-containing protein n=1 Tax=Rhodococcus sp. IEGM 1381 TaxID=3047085 RepID=UPI0024B846E8|nr:hypothetical protein [Rhodococcus sp. IEGM 1381]MDI9894507.1 hypothetical protein [Rhodococcus sp. IEGM 1381]
MTTTHDTRAGRWVAARQLPVDVPLIPSATRNTLRRAATVYMAVWIAGGLLLAFGNNRAGVLGAGMMVPGGGHLASGHVVHAVVAMLVFVSALLVWWMIGAVVAPIVVWVGFAIEATATAGHAHSTTTLVIITACLIPGLSAAALSVHAVRHRAQIARARTINTELSAVRYFESAVPSTPEPPVAEASAEDLAHLRFAVDLALQPLDEFAGFDRRDQFREAALRYQLSILGYALSMYRFTHTPAFSGYLGESQERAVLKMGDRRVWGYWAAENAWGRMSLNRDPVENRDNVMLTGWQGAAVGMYESFGDDRFSRPGGLTYTWSESEKYEHDFTRLAESIHRNMKRSPYTLFSCEPRWIYPVCNTFGVNTLILHDRLHGTDFYAELRDDIEHAYEREFQRPDGRLIGVRNETLGLTWNIWASEGVSLPTTYWMNAFLPDQAHRAWWLLRRNALTYDGERYVLPRNAGNRCDVGSYSFGSDSFSQTFLSLSAREMGDNDVADAAFAYVDGKEEVTRHSGVARYSGLSTQGNLYSLMARFARPSVNRDLIGAGLPTHWITGPRLAEVAYPQVLVAKAVTDGRALDLVLRPGSACARTAVVVDRLRPHSSYALRGGIDESVVADSAGKAVLHFDLEDRTVLRLEPTW